MNAIHTFDSLGEFLQRLFLSCDDERPKRDVAATTTPANTRHFAASADWLPFAHGLNRLWQCHRLVAHSAGDLWLHIRFLNGTSTDGLFKDWRLHLDPNTKKMVASIVILRRFSDGEVRTICDAFQVAKIARFDPVTRRVIEDEPAG